MFGTKILEERTSKYNKDVKVVRTFGMGTYIQVNGLTQSGGIVESIWKRTVKKIYRSQLTVHSALVLGLGGGTVAKLINKYWPEAKITGVEIDPLMIELGKKYLELDKVKVDIKIMDANKFKIGKYDLVIVDTYLGDKYVEITGCHSPFGDRRPSHAGITVFNRLYYGDKKAEAVKFGKKLEKIFGRVEYFYPEANLMLICYNS